MKLVLAAAPARAARFICSGCSTGSTRRRMRCILTLSGYGRQVVAEELGELRVSPAVHQHGDKTMNVPFAMAALRVSRRDGHRALLHGNHGPHRRAGTADTTILRSADAFLKERRKLHSSRRAEAPWSLIHARNAVTLIEAGATIMPASPSFYSLPKTIEEVADTVVERILDKLGLPAPGACSVGRRRQPGMKEQKFKEPKFTFSAGLLRRARFGRNASAAFSRSRGLFRSESQAALHRRILAQSDLAPARLLQALSQWPEPRRADQREQRDGELLASIDAPFRSRRGARLQLPTGRAGLERAHRRARPR